jgi:hypothetical protein
MDETKPLLLGITGIDAEELAVELAVRDKLLGSFDESGKSSLASILFRPLGRAVVFQLTISGDRVLWESYEGEAAQVHEFFQEVNRKDAA